MLLHFCTTSRENIAGDANLDRDLPLGEVAHQFRIVHRMQAMTDAICLQVTQRAPNGFGADRFSCVHRETQTVPGRVLIHFAELSRPGPALVATDSDSDDVSVFESNGLFNDTLRLLDSEMPHCVEDPIQRYPKLSRAALSPAFRTFE